MKQRMSLVGLGRVRRHVRSWRKPTPHSKAHPLVNRLNLASRIAQPDQRTALPDQCLRLAEADVRPQGGGPGLTAAWSQLAMVPRICRSLDGSKLL